jgi:diaminohydroxyphosphoribosylaminopyrimidine deaminase/5-amino-6-(5-phosphoribosylamino)uracil reductase
VSPRSGDVEDADQSAMRLALAEAARGLGRTAPNPAVGAVIVRDGEVLARGFHARAGTAHAEIVALDQLGARGAGAAVGTTLYSTLEPCNHTGRTGPCTEAIIAAGVRRVVVGAIDPNPRVAGQGLARLRAAGLEVVDGVLAAECAALNTSYNHAIVHRRPYVVLKAATSLDGRIATRTGASQWITGPEARAEGHRLRDRLDAVLVGSGTVLADDPVLTARLDGARDPRRVVLDGRLRTPPSARLVTTAREVPTLIFTRADAPAEARARLEAAGVEVVTVPDTDGRLELGAVLDALHARGVNGLLVEGGASVHGAFVDAGLVQRLVWFVAPLVLGGEAARPAVGGLGAGRLDEALRLGPLSVRTVGADLMIEAEVRTESPDR